MTNREAVIWLINVTADIGKAEHSDLWHYEQALSEIKEMLESQPERKKGYWIKKEPTIKELHGCYYECSKCHKFSLPFQKLNFCPNCGADMRGTECDK